MSIFSKLAVNDSIEEQGDSLGGGNLASGVYDMTIDMAYVTVAKSGALGVTVHYLGADGNVFKAPTEYITSGDAKGNKNTFTHPKTKKEQYLPGFSVINNLVNLVTGKHITDIEPEEKVVNLYDYESKKEVPTKTQVLMDLLNQKVKVGVIQQTVNKQSKGDDGKYYPTAETRSEVVVDKLFDAETGCTVTELKGGLTEGQFITAWADKWAGKVRNKVKEVSGPQATAGAPVAAAPAATKSLFPGKA